MKILFATCLMSLLAISSLLQAQKLHVEIYKEGTDNKSTNRDSTRRAHDMARLQDEMQRTQRKLDSIGRQLSKLYTDSAFLVLKFNKAQFDKMSADMHKQLDDMVDRMAEDRDKMQHNYTFNFRQNSPGDSGSFNIGKYKVIIRGNDSFKTLPAMPQLPPIPNMAAPAHHPCYIYSSSAVKFGGLSIGFNGLVDNNGVTSNGPLALNNAKSVEVQIGLFKQYFNIAAHHFYLSYGTSVSFNNYRLPNNIMIEPRQPQFTATPTPADADYRKNKLNVNWVDIPVALRYESNKYNFKKSFHLEAGVFGGYRINAHTKEIKSDGSKNKQWDNFNLSDFRYGTNLTVGYGRFNLCASYTISNFFKPGEGIPGTEYHPFTVGIVLNHI